MKNLTALLGSIAIATSSFSALAASSIWTPWDVVTRVTDYGSGVRLKGIDGTSNPANCTKEDQVRIDADLSPDARDQIGKIVLSAFLSGREIRVKLRGDSCSSDNQPEFYAVSVR